MLFYLLSVLMLAVVFSDCDDYDLESRLEMQRIRECYGSGSDNENRDPRLQIQFRGEYLENILRYQDRVSSMGALRSNADQIFPDYEKVLPERQSGASNSDNAFSRSDNSDNAFSRSNNGGRRLTQSSNDFLTIAKKDVECLCEWCDNYCDDGHICEDTNWHCDGEPLVQCGNSMDGSWGCYCDVDIDGVDVCWEDDWCINRPRCTKSSDCLADEVCIDTCCDGSNNNAYRCFKECKMPYPSVSPTPEPEPCCQVEPAVDWECFKPWLICGESKNAEWICICDYDVNGNWFCWEDNWCSNLSTCVDACPDGYACIPDTCCGVPKCIKKCDIITTPIVQN